MTRNGSPFTRVAGAAVGRFGRGHGCAGVCSELLRVVAETTCDELAAASSPEE